jgi:hypothetical protein
MMKDAIRTKRKYKPMYHHPADQRKVPALTKSKAAWMTINPSS